MKQDDKVKRHAHSMTAGAAGAVGLYAGLMGLVSLFSNNAGAAGLWAILTTACLLIFLWATDEA